MSNLSAYQQARLGIIQAMIIAGKDPMHHQTKLNDWTKMALDDPTPPPPPPPPPPKPMPEPQPTNIGLGGWSNFPR